MHGDDFVRVEEAVGCAIPLANFEDAVGSDFGGSEVECVRLAGGDGDRVGRDFRVRLCKGSRCRRQVSSAEWNRLPLEETTAQYWALVLANPTTA